MIVLFFRIKGVLHVLTALHQCTSMVDDVDKILQKHDNLDVTIPELRVRNQQIEVNHAIVE